MGAENEAGKPDYEVAREHLEALVSTLFAHGESPKVTLIGASVDDDKWQRIDFCVYIRDVKLDYHAGLGRLDLQRAAKELCHHYRPKLTSSEEALLRTWARTPSADFVDKDAQTRLAGKLAYLGYIKMPSVAEILGSYCRDGLDAECPFEDWASTFDYNPDSRKAYAIYQDIQQKWFKLLAIFGRENCEKMAELANRL